MWGEIFSAIQVKPFFYGSEVWGEILGAIQVKPFVSYELGVGRDIRRNSSKALFFISRSEVWGGKYC